MDDVELLKAVDRLKSTMIAVATGGPRIGEVESEFAMLYDAVDQELRHRSIANAIPYRDLWEWYGRWSGGDMPSWQSRRTFVNGIFRDLVQVIQSTQPQPAPPLSTERPPLAGPDAEWDVFVSHASEDKNDFVRPLAVRLRHLGLRVWYDETTLKLGDSLRRSIDKGLSRSRFGVVVISQHFLLKEWPQKELDGLVARETDGVKIILPVLHDITVAEVRTYSPTLADRLAVLSSTGVDNVADEIFRAVRPDAPSVPLTVKASIERQPQRGELLMVGPDIVGSGDIESIEPLIWQLHLRDFVAGDVGSLIRYAEGFTALAASDQFVVVNSIGDGRALSAAPTFSRGKDGYSVRFSVASSAARTPVQELPSSWASSPETNDLYAENGNIARVSGAAAFPQRLREVLSHMKGESPMYTDFGSRLQEYYWRFREFPWLHALFKAEIIRLSAIPYVDTLQNRSYTPLQCVERVWGVEVLSDEPKNDRLPLRLDLEVKGVGRGQHDVSVLMPPQEIVAKVRVSRPPIAMVQRGLLLFPDRGHQTDSTSGAIFWGEDGNKRIRCIISREALDDHFSDGDLLGPDAAFLAHRAEIQAFASQKYARGNLEADGSIIIRTDEFV